MFGWVENAINSAAAGLYRRGQGIVEAGDRITEERRAAVRAVRDALSEAMTAAEDHREHGSREAGSRALVAANRASAVVHEVPDDEARRLVLDWKTRYDASPKGRRYSDHGAPGYPEPGWSELRHAAEAAHERLGVVLRDLMEQ